MHQTFELTNIENSHIDEAVALSTSVGWSHRPEDWAMILAHSTGRVARLNGRIVGTALRTDYGPGLSTLSMIIVAQDQRGQGLGRQLVGSTLDARPSTACRLISTASGKPLYTSLGFREVGQITQMLGHIRSLPDLGPAYTANADDKAGIRKLDLAAFGGDRGALLDWLLKHGQMAVLRAGGEVSGFAASRKFGAGYVIGPVVAPDAKGAMTLISHLVRPLSKELVRLDCIGSDDLLAQLEDMGLSPTDRAPIMQLRHNNIAQEYRALVSQGFC